MLWQCNWGKHASRHHQTGQEKHKTQNLELVQSQCATYVHGRTMQSFLFTFNGDYKPNYNNPLTSYKLSKICFLYFLLVFLNRLSLVSSLNFYVLSTKEYKGMQLHAILFCLRVSLKERNLQLLDWLNPMAHIKELKERI